MWLGYMVAVESIWVVGSVLSLVTLGTVGCCCSQQQQQQQQVITKDNDSPKRVCPECGMENPREANHCGDCGFTFKSGEE